jgi:hypothetical protein
MKTEIIALLIVLSCLLNLQAQVPIKLDMDVEEFQPCTVTKEKLAVVFNDDRRKKIFYFIIQGVRQDFNVIEYVDPKLKLPESEYTAIATHVQSGNQYTIALFSNGMTTYTIANTKGNFPFWVLKYKGLMEEKAVVSISGQF